MRFPINTPWQATTLPLMVVGLASLTFSCPVAAQNLTATLSGVTFNDGAVASGYFDFNVATQTLSSFDITTTDGLGDGLTGANYTPATLGTNIAQDVSNGVFIFPQFHYLVINSFPNITGPDVYALDTGVVESPSGFHGSGEFAPTSRVITAGSLIVTAAEPVPEASTTVSFGLLLALGMGGVVIAAKKKKAAASA